MKFHYLSSSPYQMTDCTLQDLKVHYHVHNTPPFVCVLSQIISSMPSHPISLRSISILSSHLCLGLPCSLLPSYFPSELFLFRCKIKDPTYTVSKPIFWPLYMPEAYLHAYCMALLLVKLSSQSCHLFLQHPLTDLELLCLSCCNSQCPLLLNCETPQLCHLSFVSLQLWQLQRQELNEKSSELEETLTMNDTALKKTKLRGLSPRANYTDRAAAAGRRS